jgi:hypothetical protein
VPFTASHAAAVVPLLRLGLPASALVIGSMSPDLPYFVPVHLGGFYLPVDLGGPTHTAWAVVTLDVVIGALAWAGWHGLLAAPAQDAAPAPLRARLAGRVAGGADCRVAGEPDSRVVGRVRPGLRHRAGTPRELLAVYAALAVGAATHVGWDEFTHPGRWGTTHVPALAAVWAGMPGYRWAQYGSGLAGAVVLGAFAGRWWRATRPSPGPRTATSGRRRAVVVASAAAVAGVAVPVAVRSALAADGLRAAGFAAVTRGGAACLAVAVLLAAAWHAQQAHEARRAARSTTV